MTLARLIAISWAYRGRLAICLALMICETAAALVIPWLGGRLASGILSASQISIGPIAGAIVLVMAIQAVLRIASGLTLSATAEHIVAKLRKDLYDHLQSLPIGFHQTRQLGDTLSLLTREVEQLANFMTGTLLGFIPKALTLLGALVLMVRIDPILAVPVVAGIPIFFIVLKLVGRRLRPLAGEIRSAYADTVGLAQENFSILPAIKSFTREPLETVRYHERTDRLRDLSVRMARIHAWLGPILQLVTAIAVVGIIWVASSRINNGSMEPAELVAFLLYAALLTRPVSALADNWGQLQQARGALTHLDQVLQTDPEPYREGAKLKSVRGDVVFENVTFAHPERAPALKELTLRIQAGETVALTGPNGAGKSTLINLLLRFYVPDSGRITLDGRDIQGLELNSLRASIALVPQDVFLFDGTVEENVRFGNPEAEWEGVLSAARRAQAISFIEKLPQGFQTTIGDRGVRLSGGQRQRIALARALLKDPAILVLDEPTAMFDPEGEERFVQDVRDAFEGHTVILITHRPASLALADRVLWLENGSIVAPPARHEHEPTGAA